MKSIFYKKEENGIAKSVYSNATYDFTVGPINNSGELDINLARKTQELDVITKQLAEDLAGATIKVQTLMDGLNDLVTRGIIPQEYFEQITQFVYNNDSPKTSR